MVLLPEPEGHDADDLTGLDAGDTSCSTSRVDAVAEARVVEGDLAADRGQRGAAD
jgi:hypothetical protein